MEGRRIPATEKRRAKSNSRAEPMHPHDRYKQLMQSARNIVERGGVGALTMSALTKEAGVSRPVVYEHFENSEDVAVALLEDYFENIVSLVDERARGEETLEAYLEKAIEAEFEYHCGESLMVRNLTNGHATGMRLNEAYLRLRQNTIETFEELLSQQGVSAQVARIGGYALAELIPSVVYEFASEPIADTAKETLTAMVIGAIKAINPDGVVRPETPEKVLRASRDIKKLRERIISNRAPIQSSRRLATDNDTG
jgi:AcrR family transcriptional regulator